MSTSTNECVHKFVYFDHNDNVRTVLGLILSENEHFFEVRTRKNTFNISKKAIISYSLTSQKFQFQLKDFEK